MIEDVALLHGYRSICHVTSSRMKVWNNAAETFSLLSVFQPKIGNDINEILKLLKEIQEKTAAFESVCIVPLSDFFAENDYIFIIRKFYENGTLLHQIAANGPMEGSRLFSFSEKLIDLVATFHSNNMSVGDIRPGVIAINSHNDPVLTGFSIAKMIEDPDDENELKSYLAPEILLNKHKCDPLRADIWSLGVTLYVIAVGALPWPTNNKELMIHNIILGKFTIPEKVDQKFGALIKKMLDPNPESRPKIENVRKFPCFKKKLVKTLSESHADVNRYRKSQIIVGTHSYSKTQVNLGSTMMEVPLS